MPPFELGIWYLNIAATVALVLRLWWSHLIHVYRWLFLYLLTDALQQCLRLYFPNNSNRSAETYMVGQAVKIVLVVFVVLELYRLALAGQPALAKYGRKTAGAVLCTAAGVAALGLWIDRTVPAGRSPILYRFFSFERTMDSWVLIFLVMISLFMTWFPVRMKRNVALYVSGFMFFFLARSGYLLLLNLMGSSWLDVLNSVFLSISLVCLAVWLYAFGKEGETTSTVVGHRWDPGAMDRLSGQLESINASLMKMSRSVKGV